MPMPAPHSGESQNDFMGRCMGDKAMMAEFESQKQRTAVCMAQWRKKNDIGEDDDAMPETDDERRDFSAQFICTRSDDSTRLGLLTGHAIVFDSLSEDLGGIREIIKPAAIERTLRGKNPVLAFYNHDPGAVLGNTASGTLRLFPDARGLGVEIDLPRTEDGHKVRELVTRRDIQGMSFGFRVMPDGFSMDWDTSPPTRIVTDMVFREISVVSLPAYRATNVAVALRHLELAKRSIGYRPSLAMNRARLRQAGQ